VITLNPVELLDQRPAIDQGWAVSSWAELLSDRPDLAKPGRALLYQHGVGLAFLATVRSDGGPRLHPMCPLLTDCEMFAFVIPSPKQRDLMRDGRYAVHSFPRPDNEDAFFVTGTARLVDEQATRSTLARQFVEERSAFSAPEPVEEDLLFSFSIETCLLTVTTGHGDPRPRHTIWRAK
jgi:hypothetical protein